MSNLYFAAPVPVAYIGRLAVRAHWLAPYLAPWFPNWTEEEQAEASDLPAYHADSLEEAEIRAGKPEWILRLVKHTNNPDGTVAFQYEFLEVIR